ncbi:MAG: WD40 repeat domain-containing protein, partial [Planctomycetota bacterium]
EVNAALDGVRSQIDALPQDHTLRLLAERIRAYADALTAAQFILTDVELATPENADKLRKDIRDMIQRHPRIAPKFDAALAKLERLNAEGIEASRAVIRAAVAAIDALQTSLGGRDFDAILMAWGNARQQRIQVERLIEAKPALRAEGETVLARFDGVKASFDALNKEYTRVMNVLGEAEGFLAAALPDIENVNVDQLQKHKPVAEQWLTTLEELRTSPALRFTEPDQMLATAEQGLRQIQTIDLSQRLPEDVQHLINRAAGADSAPAAKLVKEDITAFLAVPANGKWASSFAPTLTKLDQVIASAPANVEPVDPNLPRVTARFQRVGPLTLKRLIPGITWCPAGARPIEDLAFEPNNNRLTAAVGAPDPQFVILEDGSVGDRPFLSGGKAVHAIDWINFRNTVMLGCEDGKVRGINGTRFGPSPLGLDGHFENGSRSNPIRVLRLIYGDAVITGADDLKVFWWASIRGPIPDSTMANQQRAVTCAASSPDGKYVAVGSLDTQVRVYLSADGSRKSEFTGHVQAVRDVVYTPDGKKLISASDDATIRIMAPLGRDMNSLVGHGAAVTSLIVLENGRYLLSGSADGTLRIWDLETSQSVLTADLSSDAGYKVTRMRLSNDGKKLAVGTQKGDVLVFDVASGWSPR